MTFDINDIPVMTSDNAGLATEPKLQPENLSNDEVKVLLNRAINYQQDRFFPEAEAIYKQILKQHPNDYVCHYNLGLMALNFAKFDQALLHANAALKARPNDTNAIGTMGEALFHTQEFPKAATCMKAVLAQNPDDFIANYILGACYTRFDQYEDAEYHLQKAYQQKPTNANVIFYLSNLYYTMGKTKESIKFSESWVSQDPQNPQPHIQMGDTYLSLGETKKAQQSFRKAIELNPASGAAYMVLARTLKRDSKEAQELTNDIEHTIQQIGTEHEATIPFHFGLAQCHDKLGQYDAAFNNLKTANRLTINFIEKNPLNGRHDSAKQIADLKAVFTKDFIESKQAFGSDTKKPVFIVGMPRSGTTLLNQMVSNHSKCETIGERKVLAQVMTELLRFGGNLYPFSIQHAKGEDFARWTQIVQKPFEQFESQIKKVINKLPMHYYSLGLIKSFFPKAKIIHCTRHPLDNGLSLFMQLFDDALMCRVTSSLEQIAQFYKDQCALMDYWKELFSNDIHTIRYEDVIDTPKEEVTKVLDFCNLRPENACFHPETNTAQINTASAAQARKKLYSSSVGRWKDYETHLQPLAAALKDEIEAYERRD